MLALGALALLVLVVAAGFAAGSSLIIRLPGWQSRWEHFVYSTAVGLGILAYAMLAAGLLGWLRLPVAIAVVCLLGLTYLLRRGKAVAIEGNTEGQPGKWKAAAWAAGLFLGIIAGLSLLEALAPPSGADWDGLSYHLAVPKIYLRAARIYYLGWMSHSNFPFTWEMLYAVGLMLQGARLAKLFHWLAGALAAAAAYFVARQASGRRAGVLAACCFAAAPLAGWEATVAGNDLAASLYTLLALGALLHWHRSGDKRWLWLCGALAGLAAGCKMTALLLITFLVPAVLVQGTSGKRLRHAVQLAVIALVIASPWYVKSTMWTGNPVYPFFYELFGGKYWSAEAAALYRQEQLSFGMGRGLAALLLLPWNLTMHGNKFSNWPERTFTIATQSLGPLLLALVPMFWLRRLSRGEKALLAYCVIALVAWFWMSQHIRYMLPTAAILCVLAGIGADKAAQAGTGKVVGAAYAAAALWAVLVLGLGALGSFPAALGLESEPRYLARTLDEYPAVKMVNSLPAEAKVIMYGETRGFYFDRDYMWGNHHHEMLLYDRMADVRQLIGGYRSMGVTHVLVTASFLSAVRTGQEPLSRLMRQALAEGLLKPVAESRGYALYAVQ